MQKSRAGQRIRQRSNDSSECFILSHPPITFLPPFPPPLLPPLHQSNADTKFPILEDRTGKLTGRSTNTKASLKKNTSQGTVNVNFESKKNFSRKPASIDNAVWTNLSPGYMCFLCGINCSRGDLLYAHLLVLIHNFVPQPHANLRRFQCRRCGHCWEGELNAQRIGELNKHGCIQQKAAYLSQFMVPTGTMNTFGLPFLCLFCCTEPPPDSRHYKQGQIRVKAPLKLCESSMRFQSKLHLTVHILCRHSAGARSDQCAECSFTIGRAQKSEDLWDSKQFWSAPIPRIGKPMAARSKTEDVSSSTESESDVPRNIPKMQDTILHREGLPLFERHLDEVHWPVFKFLYWAVRQSQTALNTTRDCETYSCPLCELSSPNITENVSTPRGEISSESSLRHLNKKHAQFSNASLQAHVVCYHAGARQLDSIMGLCQVCGHTDLLRLKQSEDLSFRNPYVQGSLKHLLQSGHVRRVQQQFELCLRQQRLTPQGVHCVFDWSTTCLFCWRRFTQCLGPNSKMLQAQCELQTHLLVMHCSPLRTNDRSDMFRIASTQAISWIQPCGWCGQTMDDSRELESCEPVSDAPELLRAIINSDPLWKRLYEQHCWQEAHEKQHAAALYHWWQQQPFLAMNSGDR